MRVFTVKHVLRAPTAHVYAKLCVYMVFQSSQCVLWFQNTHVYAKLRVYMCVAPLHNNNTTTIFPPSTLPHNNNTTTPIIVPKSTSRLDTGIENLFELNIVISNAEMHAIISNSVQDFWHTFPGEFELVTG